MSIRQHVVICTVPETGEQWAVGTFRSEQIADDFITEASAFQEGVNMEAVAIQSPREFFTVQG